VQRRHVARKRTASPQYSGDSNLCQNLIGGSSVQRTSDVNETSSEMITLRTNSPLANTLGRSGHMAPATVASCRQFEIQALTQPTEGRHGEVCITINIIMSKLHLRHKQTDKQTKGQADRHQESNFVHFCFKMWHTVEIILMIFLIIN